MTRLRRTCHALLWSLLAVTAPVEAQVSDTTPPVLVSIDFTPAAVDVTAAAQNVVVTARITDDLAGVSFICLWFISPSGAQQAPVNSQCLQRISGTSLDGVYQSSLSIPRFSEAGVWKLHVNSMVDLANNRTSISAAQLQALGFPTDLTVTSTPDTQAPNITALNLAPATIDVSGGPQEVTATMTLTDNLAGVVMSPGIRLTFRSPSGGQRQYVNWLDLSLVAGNNLNGEWSGAVTIPHLAEPGVWILESLHFSDNANNQAFIDNNGFAARGLTNTFTVISSPADTAAPQITGFSLTPGIIDTSLSSQEVVVRMNLTDDSSGLDFAPDTPNSSFLHGVQFISPSGIQFVSCCFFSPTFTLQAGTPLNGTWQRSISFPRFSETGTWKVSLIQIKDGVRNLLNLNSNQMAAMGFPTDVVVYRPSLTPDGMVGAGGGTITDETFGDRASVAFPPGALPANTEVAIDVLATSLGLPTPAGFSTGSLFVNINLNPAPPMPFPAPGLTVVLPLTSPLPAGASLQLFRLDPGTGLLVPAVSVAGTNVAGTVNADTLSATFTGVSRLSTVVAFQPTAVPGDVSGDGVVNCADIAIVRAAFGKRTGQPGYDIRADLNRNGIVDVSDLALVSRQLPAGTTCP